MPMVDDVAQSLMSKPKASGRPRDTAARSIECVANQLAFTLVYLFFEGALSACRLSVCNRSVHDCTARTGTQARRGIRIQLFSQPFISFSIQISDLAGRQKVLELFQNGEEHPSGYVTIAGSFCDMSRSFEQAKRRLIATHASQSDSLSFESFSQEGVFATTFEYRSHRESDLLSL